MKKLTIIFLILNAFALAQVGIDTTTPNGASILDVVSTEKGIMIPRLTNAERDTKLADNDIASVPPSGVVNTAIEPGLLIFNTDAKAFQYWDGELWKQLFVNTTTTAGNDGVVKVNGQNGSSTDQPTISLSGQGNGYGQAIKLIYNGSLYFAPAPITSWPENEQNPGTSAIYDSSNDLWKENPVEGQVHVWRLIAKVSAGSSSSGSVIATLTNPSATSDFTVNSISYLPQGSGLGNIITFYFYTIADSNSIGPGKGYEIYFQADATCSLTMESLTRVSLFKD